MGEKTKKNHSKARNYRTLNIQLAAIYVLAVIVFTIFVSWIVLAKTVPVETNVFNGISGNAIQLVKVPQVAHDSQMIVLIGAIISVLVLISLIIFLVRLKSD